jgi:hypothetical protein
MTRISATVVAGTDTETELVLKIDGAEIADHTLISGARLKLSGAAFTLNSATYPNAWNFTNEDKIIVKFGRGDLVPGRYRGKLVTIDPAHPNGINWDTDFSITIL